MAKTFIKVSGTWREVINIWRHNGSTFVPRVMSWIKAGGVWNECMEYVATVLDLWYGYNGNPVPNPIVVGGAGGTIEIIVESNSTWDAVSSVGSVSPSSGGAGETVIYVTYPDNYDGTYWNITVTNNVDGVYKMAYVSQGW